VEKRVLIVSPPDSYRIVPYIRAAQSLDLIVHLASHGEWAMSSPDAAGIEIPLDDFPRALVLLETYSADKKFSAVIGTDDSTLVLAAALAAKTGLTQNSPGSVNIARRKDLSRKALETADVLVPDFQLFGIQCVDAQFDPDCGFPCVVKPLALAGSRGVIRADNPEQLQMAIRRTISIITGEDDPFESDHVLIEAFIPGNEYAMEGMLHNGDLEVLAVFDKPDLLNGPYFEETYYVMPSALSGDVQSLMADTVQKACYAFGLVSGPVHAECRVNDDGIWLIELAARTIGGLCSRLLTFGTGYTLEQLVLANACGLALPRQLTKGAAGVLMLPIHESGVLRRVEGILKAEKVEYVDEIQITIREGFRLVALPEGSSYLGFVFASAPDAARVESALRAAHEQLNVVIAPFWPVVGQPLQ
jgi:formate-dependent phosphoribosylglycinamide formyltransferase (GAR transformylase)